jgi:protoporphyrin/coproporphyrin ferrochelatase
MAQQSRFSKEPPFSHGQTPKTAVLLCNLGTPQAPETGALRRYLAEFLSDPRVVEIPKWLWLIILHGIILRVRPAKSAQKYAVIWTPEGSPLKVWTQTQAQLLQASFDAKNESVLVRYCMRYGEPSVAREMDALRELGVTRVLILPAYPQYCAATTASVFDAVYAWAKRARFVPEFRFINHYHDHSGYISALAHKIRTHWSEHGQAPMLIMSFHGVPERTLLLGDPYHCECHKTARLLAQALGLQKHQYRVTFQSRFGKAKWLEPYTEPTVRALAKEGVRHIQVVCPGFTSDCLETLEEIAMEVREAFLEDGGSEFEYIPCLNNTPEWIEALSQVAHQHLLGWDLKAVSPQDLSNSREHALALGAQD